MQTLVVHPTMPWKGTFHDLPQVEPFGIVFGDYYYYTNTWMQWYYEILALQQLLEYSAMGMGLAGDKNGDGKLEYEELLEYTNNMQRLSKSDGRVVKGLRILLRNFWIIAEERGFLLECDLRERLFKLFYRVVSNVLLRPQLADALADFVRSFVYSGVLDRAAIAALTERVKDRMRRKDADPSIVYRIFIAES